MTILEKLNDFKGAQIIGLDAVTEVKLLGGQQNPMQGKVKKVTTGSQVMIFKNGKGYKNMVNRRLKKQNAGDLTTMALFEAIASSGFEPGPRQWGQRVEGTPFVEHKEKLYLECIFIKPGKSTYFLGDEEINKEDIIGLQEKKEGDQGGLIDKVIVRTFAIDSILKVRKAKQEIEGPAIP
jgi:hypothetical protein